MLKAGDLIMTDDATFEIAEEFQIPVVSEVGTLEISSMEVIGKPSVPEPRDAWGRTQNEAAREINDLKARCGTLKRTAYLSILFGVMFFIGMVLMALFTSHQIKQTTENAKRGIMRGNQGQIRTAEHLWVKECEPKVHELVQCLRR